MPATATTQRRRALPAPRVPRGVLVGYTSELLALSRRMDAEILAALAAERIDDAGSTLPPMPSQLHRAVLGMRDRLAAVLRGRDVIQAVERAGRRTIEAARTQWHRAVRSVLGFVAPDVDSRAMLAEFAARNVSLLHKLAADKARHAEEAVRAREPVHVELSEAARDAIVATEWRAGLIARDQIGRLHARINQALHRAAGVRSYYWVTRGDERVRPGHVALNGRHCLYDAPPWTGDSLAHPGEEIGCRCVAQPAIPGTPLPVPEFL